MNSVVNTPYKSYDVRFHHPSTILISGVSGTGKTHLTKQILENADNVFKPDPPKFVVLVYHTWQTIYQQMVDKGLINLCLKEIPDYESLKDICSEYKDNSGILLIIDDKLSGIDSHIVDIFCVYSHHLRITVLLLVQTLFSSNKDFRHISLNSQYIFLMKNTRDSSSITHLAKQIFPYKTRFLTESYINATKHPYSHLLLDLRQETESEVRVRANIFDEAVTVYTLK